MRTPPHGGSPYSFCQSNERSSDPGAMRTQPSHVPAATPTSAVSTFGPERSRAAAGLSPAWHSATAQLGTKVAADIEEVVGSHDTADDLVADSSCLLLQAPNNNATHPTARERRAYLERAV